MSENEIKKEKYVESGGARERATIPAKKTSMPDSGLVHDLWIEFRDDCVETFRELDAANSAVK